MIIWVRVVLYLHAGRVLEIEFMEKPNAAAKGTRRGRNEDTSSPPAVHSYLAGRCNSWIHRPRSLSITRDPIHPWIPSNVFAPFFFRREIFLNAYMQAEAGKENIRSLVCSLTKGGPHAGHEKSMPRQLLLFLPFRCQTASPRHYKSAGHPPSTAALNPTSR